MAEREKVIRGLECCALGDCVRAEKFNISMKLNKLLESLNTLETLKEDPA